MLRALYDGALRPDTLAHTLRHFHELLPTRPVARGEHIRPLPVGDRQLGPLRFESNGRTYDLIDHLCLHRVSGFLVLHRGEIVYETYELAARPESLFTSMSMVKSIATTLVGAALHDGAIASLDEPVTKYVTELAGSAYESMPIRDLLRMRSGVQWNETYTDPVSDRRRMLDAQIGQEPGAILALMASLPRAAPSGARFNYSTGETHVVGALVRAAVGQPLADYLSRTMWAPLGMEAAALWSLESPDGLEIGGSGLAARLRDFARFGEFIRADGVIDGRRVVPAGFLAEATTPGPRNAGEPPYGFMWWPIDADEEGAIHHGAFQASGIFGQHLYIHPAAEVVIAQTAALPKPMNAEPYPETTCFGAIVAALTTAPRPL
jgi:CubicO group peptidase (beta-lactamase class C family)